MSYMYTVDCRHTYTCTYKWRENSNYDRTKVKRKYLKILCTHIWVKKRERLWTDVSLTCKQNFDIPLLVMISARSASPHGTLP